MDKYEKSKVAQIEVFLCSGVDASSVTALIAEDDQFNDSRSQLRNAYRQQVEQVKKFLSDQAKQMAKIRQVSSGEKGNADSETVDDNSEAHRQQTLITGVCADVLLQMRSKFDSSWQQLRQEEETLRREVALCQQSMHSMLREDDVQEQNGTLHREILSLLTQSTTSTRNSVDGNVGCGTPGENDDASQCTARSTATQPKTVTARPAIPDDDPEFMALIGDIAAQVHRIDNQLAQLQSAKQEEVKRLLLSLDMLPNTDSSAKTTAATSVPSDSASSNMYETLPEVETTIDRGHSTQMDNNVSVNEDQSAIQRSEAIETLTQSSVVEACTSPRPSSPTDAAVSPTKIVIPAALWSYGGWTASDHDLFAKIYRAAETKGTKRSKMLEQLTQQLCSSSSSSSSSTRTLEDILLHEEWYRAQRVITRKYKELIQTLHVQRQDCISQGQQQVQAYIKEYQEQSLRDKDLQQQEERRQQLHAHLERLREERLLAENERLRLLAASSAQEQLLLEEQLQQQQAERERKKSLVEAYKAQKKAMEIAKETERQRQQQEAQAALQQLLEQNKSRVEFRAQQQEVKLQQRKLKEDEELNKEQRRLEFLNALAAQVNLISCFSLTAFGIFGYCLSCHCH